MTGKTHYSQTGTSNENTSNNVNKYEQQHKTNPKTKNVIDYVFLHLVVYYLP